MSQLIRSMFVSAVACVAAACSSSTTSAGFSADSGAAVEKLPVGSPCASDDQCGPSPFMCMMDGHPGGYCMRDCNIANGDADCPSEAICQFDGMTGECHLKCNSNSDCRQGYTCSPASNTAMSKASHAFCDAMPPMDAGADGM